jgi:kumamolisin
VSSQHDISDDLVPISGSERIPLHKARSTGPADPNEKISVIMQLRSGDEVKKNAHIERLMSEKPAQRQYLSREEFSAAYGAANEDLEKVKRFAEKYGLDIVEASAPKRIVKVTGTVASLSKAFGVKLERYQYPGGEYRGRVGPVKVPSDLISIVEGVYGLDNRKQVRPFFRLSNAMTKNKNTQRSSGSSQPFDPTTLAKLYDFPTSLDGSNQCIGILEFGGGFTNSDLVSYFSKLGLPTPQVSVVSIGSATNSPDGSGLHSGGVDAEVLLDIEVSASIAPKAKIVVYFANIEDPGFEDAINTAIHDKVNKPSVISISWGGAEFGWASRTVQNMNKLFQDAATLLGITVCCASGDDGSSCERPGSQNNFEIEDSLAHAAFPASSPFVLACGGTNLEVSNNMINTETVWNENSMGGGATGGGVSDIFDVPDYQKGLGIPHSVNSDGRVGRGIPDVCGYAAGVPGYDVIVDGDEGGVGGTSAVAPLWAGLIALLNQSSGRSIGFVNPLLYGKAASGGAFRDIIIGDNSVSEPVQGKGKIRIKGYNARQGWDACTGLGSPDGAKLLTILG